MDIKNFVLGEEGGGEKSVSQGLDNGGVLELIQIFHF